MLHGYTVGAWIEGLLSVKISGKRLPGQSVINPTSKRARGLDFTQLSGHLWVMLTDCWLGGDSQDLCVLPNGSHRSILLDSEIRSLETEGPIYVGGL